MASTDARKDLGMQSNFGNRYTFLIPLSIFVQSVADDTAEQTVADFLNRKTLQTSHHASSIKSPGDPFPNI